MGKIVYYFEFLKTFLDFFYKISKQKKNNQLGKIYLLKI